MSYLMISPSLIMLNHFSNYSLIKTFGRQLLYAMIGVEALPPTAVFAGLLKSLEAGMEANIRKHIVADHMADRMLAW